MFEQYGKYLFEEEPDADKRKKRVKQITNGYDMGSKLDTWAKRLGNPHKRSVGKMTAKRQGGTQRRYAKSQPGGLLQRTATRRAVDKSTLNKHAGDHQI